MHYIWKEWKENLKGKGYWLSFSLVVIVSISLLVNTSALSFEQGFYVLLINLFDALAYLLPLLCIFLGAFALYQEKEQRTLVMLLTRRDTFASFLLKKSVALQSVIIIPILIWFILFLFPSKFLFLVDWSSYASYLLALVCLIVVFTQIGIFIGSVSISKIQMIGFAIAIWFYFFFIHDFLLLSYLSEVTYENVKSFAVAFFLNPLQAARIFLESSLGIYNFDHMSKMLQSFMWLNPIIFLFGNAILIVALSIIGACAFHKKEGLE